MNNIAFFQDIDSRNSDSCPLTRLCQYILFEHSGNLGVDGPLVRANRSRELGFVGLEKVSVRARILSRANVTLMTKLSKCT